MHLQVLSALNFYAGGSYQRRVGRDAHNYVCQSIVSRSVRNISDLISKHLGPKYVKFPQSDEEIESTKAGFYIKYKVPGIIGLVDCTHLPLAALKKEIEIPYVNRKGFHSLNAQIIGNVKNLILNINARYPGSIHDSIIWRNSKVLSHLEQRYNVGIYDEYLFGDSGYPLEPWLLVPISDPVDAVDRNFNHVQKTIRSGIERTIALWKGTFRCLLGERKLRYQPETLTNIANACAVIHNILVANNAPFYQQDLGEIVPMADALPNEYHTVGDSIRRRLAEQIY